MFEMLEITQLIKSWFKLFLLSYVETLLLLL